MSSFPDSRNIAVACLLRSEKSRRGKPELNEAYVKFMRYYVELGHMEEVPVHEVYQDKTYYLPYHAVPGTGKFRVVFNASQKASNGISLNDCLHQGKNFNPTLLKFLLVGDSSKLSSLLKL